LIAKKRGASSQIAIPAQAGMTAESSHSPHPINGPHEGSLAYEGVGTGNSP
jgi:hypothetical protein